MLAHKARLLGAQQQGLRPGSHYSHDDNLVSTPRSPDSLPSSADLAGVCVHVCVYVNFVFMCVFSLMCVLCVCTCACAYACVCVLVRLRVRVRVRMRVRVRVRARALVRVRLCLRLRLRLCGWVWMWVWV